MSTSVATVESDLVVELLASLGLAAERSNTGREGADFTCEKFDVWGGSEVSFQVPVLGCTCFRIPEDEPEMRSVIN
jgi:hypothetical protein